MDLADASVAAAQQVQRLARAGVRGDRLLKTVDRDRDAVAFLPQNVAAMVQPPCTKTQMFISCNLSRPSRDGNLWMRSDSSGKYLVTGFGLLCDFERVPGNGVRCKGYVKINFKFT